MTEFEKYDNITPAEVEYLGNVFGHLVDVLNTVAKENPEAAEKALNLLLERVRKINAEKETPK